MYPNLLGQKAYYKLTDEDMAKIIDVSRNAYSAKIKSGRFYPEECKKYCDYFKKSFLWLGDKDKTLAYEPKSNEMVLTVHRWFANKSCPGDWLYNRLGDLADKVTSKLVGSSDNTDDGTIYRVQTGAFSQKANAEAQLKKLKEAGFDGFITTGTVQKPDNTPDEPVLTVGDKVKLDSDATVYGTSMKFSSWIYDSTLYEREISGDRVVISTQKTGDITGAVDKKYLNKI